MACWSTSPQNLAAILLLLASLPSAAAEAPPPGESVPFASLPGFAGDDLAKAFRVWRGSCAAIKGPALGRGSIEVTPALKRACAAAPVKANASQARAFFERHFVPRRVPGDAFFTGYYEPVIEGSLVPTKAFPTPLYARPADLVTIKPGMTPGLDPTLNAARRLPDGRLVAVPDRSGIETGGLGTAARPIVYVGDPVEAFFIQIQGSGRIRLPTGQLRRLVFAGRNGHPYTSIGKILVARLNIPPRDMGMGALKAWIREHGQGPNDAGTALMRENHSFIFFAFDDKLPPTAGPIGGQGISLTKKRSLAVDHTIWPYGLPFYVAMDMPDGRAFHHLMVAQDTGAGIKSVGRADVFFGSGPEAAQEAGPVRQTGTLYVLWPKDIKTLPKMRKPPKIRSHRRFRRK